MLNKTLRVERISLKLDGSQSCVLFDQSPNIIILPNSYPPLTELPASESYHYYDKKVQFFMHL